MDFVAEYIALLIKKTANQTSSQQIKSYLVFGERDKPEYPGKYISDQSRETTISTHVYGIPERFFDTCLGVHFSINCRQLLSFSDCLSQFCQR